MKYRIHSLLSGHAYYVQVKRGGWIKIWHTIGCFSDFKDAQDFLDMWLEEEDRAPFIKAVDTLSMVETGEVKTKGRPVEE